MRQQSGVNHLWEVSLLCSQEVAVKPTVQSAKAVLDQSDLKKSVCYKKATHSSERAAARKE